MFNIRYLKDGFAKNHFEVDFDTLFDILKAHKRGEIQILLMENEQHYIFNYESLIANLKL